MVKQNFKVIWDDEAKASLRSIYNHIKNRESIEQAKKVLDEIKDLGKSLGFMPTKFRKEEYLIEEGGDIRYNPFGTINLFMKLQKSML